jgi:hypothetical protein
MKGRRVLGIISWLGLFIRGMVSSLVSLLIANVVLWPEPEKLTIAKVEYSPKKAQ